MEQQRRDISKAEKRQFRKDKRQQKQIQKMQDQMPDLKIVQTAPDTETKRLCAMNETQAHYIISILKNRLTLGIGPAGTGKTYCCGALAAEAILAGTIDKIIITRPAQEAGEKLGSLPGELEDKYEPYIEPFRDVLNERMGKARVDSMVKCGHIQAKPLAYMRGKTFKNAFVILDEGQNTSPTQMKLFLTRIGEGCTVIVNGDVKQVDIYGESGLADAVRRLRELEGINVV